MENRLRDRRARDIDDLAYFYESAFNGGVDNIWDTFKREGFRAIALVLARLTLGESFAASLGGGEGGGAGAIGKLLSFIPGFASGGSMLIGGNPGVDRNTLSLNGQPIAKVSRGETLGIANQAASSRQAPTIVNQTFVLDNRGGVTTTKLIDDMNALARQAAIEGGQYGRALAAQDHANRVKPRL